MYEGIQDSNNAQKPPKKIEFGKTQAKTAFLFGEPDITSQVRQDRIGKIF